MRHPFVKQSLTRGRPAQGRLERNWSKAALLDCSAPALKLHQVPRLERLIGRADSSDSIESVRSELCPIVYHE